MKEKVYLSTVYALNRLHDSRRLQCAGHDGAEMENNNALI